MREDIEVQVRSEVFRPSSRTKTKTWSV